MLSVLTIVLSAHTAFVCFVFGKNKQYCLLLPNNLVYKKCFISISVVKPYGIPQRANILYVIIIGQKQ
jgi:hypothetical protein